MTDGECLCRTREGLRDVIKERRQKTQRLERES